MRDPTEGPPVFLALVGPTASGKTSLSLALARRMEVEIISMDSRQVYRGMDVGTGKATPSEREGVPHHGLDIRDPDERYSAGHFARDARGWMVGIRGRGRVPLLVGGTGFFLRALTNPLFSEPELDRERLGTLRSWLSGLTVEELVEWVGVLDPEGGSLGRKGGRHRATRAVEMALLTGYPLSHWHREGEAGEDPLSGVIVVLEHPRELLYARINDRVLRMVEEEGLIQEVEGLLSAGYSSEDPGMTGAGYREVVAYLQGSLSREDLVEEIRKSHRRYARRQMTWYRHQLPPGAHFLDATRDEGALVEEVLSLWRSGEGGVGSQDGNGRDHIREGDQE